MSVKLNREQLAALNAVAAAAERPRPGGYNVPAHLVNQLVEKGLVVLDAAPTAEGRRLLGKEKG